MVDCLIMALILSSSDALESIRLPVSKGSWGLVTGISMGFLTGLGSSL